LSLEPKNSGILSRLQHHKNQGVEHMHSTLSLNIHYLCAEFALCLALYVQVKIYIVLHGTSKTIVYCILGGVYQMRVTRP